MWPFHRWEAPRFHRINQAPRPLLLISQSLPLYRISCRPIWPPAHFILSNDLEFHISLPSASGSWMLGLQAWTTTAGFYAVLGVDESQSFMWAGQVIHNVSRTPGPFSLCPVLAVFLSSDSHLIWKGISEDHLHVRVKSNEKLCLLSFKR